MDRATQLANALAIARTELLAAGPPSWAPDSEWVIYVRIFDETVKTVVWNRSAFLIVVDLVARERPNPRAVESARDLATRIRGSSIGTPLAIIQFEDGTCEVRCLPAPIVLTAPGGVS